MTKLNQIIAVLNGKKSQTQKSLTEVHKRLQKPTLFDGISRSYQPIDEEGEKLPPETKNIQFTASEAITQARAAMVELFDLAATQDIANCQAKADIVVDGQTLLEQVPVTYLLFLEKQLVDLRTFVNTIPVLDPAEKWSFDETADCFATEPTLSNRTKKVPRSHVLYEATDKHPAQVEMYHEDVIVGQWRTVKFSGAISAQDRNEYLHRIRRLVEAIKFAREEANGREV
ncbi:MAG: hypothetical protein AAFP90_19835, partial [Planctomycetota bacterium]